MSRTRRALLLVILIAPVLVSAQSSAENQVEARFRAIQNGDADTAASIFRSALTRSPNDSRLLFGAGVAAHLQGRARDAMSFLERALKADPRLTQAAGLLGEIAYHEGDLDLAIKTYERLLTCVPSNLTVRDRLKQWKDEAALPQSSQSLKDDRFAIMFDGPVQEKLAARATTVLSAAFWRIGKALGAYPTAPINVILYSERQFRDITGAPEWSGGGFDGQVRMPIRGASQNLDEFDRVLTHELTHAMLKSLAPRNLPVWLNEGLAMYFEGRDGLRSERRLAAARIFVPLANLRYSFTGLNASQAVVAYEESAFATRALIDRAGIPGVGMLLQDLDAGQNFEQAIERFGFTFQAFEADLMRRVGVSPRQRTSSQPERQPQS
jgi:tetratricopeptide (TPR) repeat protein